MKCVSGVRNFSFLENFADVLTGWPLNGLDIYDLCDFAKRTQGQHTSNSDVIDVSLASLPLTTQKRM